MEGLCTSTRDAPPTHFMLKIEGFSSLSSFSTERYESRKFDAGGYKWKLAIYPNGNKKKDVEEEDHISLYLVLDKSCLNLKKDILVTYSLFAYDHSRDKYMEVQELSRFHSLKSESGFDKFLSHKIFDDPTHGYLMNDSCVFGAEVFVINSTTTGQCLSMTPWNTIPISYTWKIKNFSKLRDKFYYSDKFTALGHDWKIKCYPRGEESNSLSLYLILDTPESRLPPGMDVLVEYKLRVVNQVNIKNHVERKSTTTSFNASDKGWGWTSFMDLSILNKKNSGYLVKDKCIVEAEVRLLGSAKNLV